MLKSAAPVLSFGNDSFFAGLPADELFQFYALQVILDHGVKFLPDGKCYAEGGALAGVDFVF